MGFLDNVKAMRPSPVIAKSNEAAPVPAPVVTVVKGLPPIAQIKAEAEQANKESNDKAVSHVFSALGEVAINQYGKLVVRLPVGDRYCALSLDSQQADDIIQAKAAAVGKSIGKDKRTAEKEKLRGQALLDGRKVTTYVRVAEADGDHYLDLGNGDMAVTKGGSWTVEKNTHVAFSLVGGELPAPVKPDTVASGYARICAFLSRAGVPDHMHLIVTVVLLEWLRPTTAYPLLDIIGPSGGGKTTLALMLINLIDPATDWKVGETKLEESDVAAAAHIRHALFIDNTGLISQEAQNLSCRVCYGTVVMSRELYSQSTVFQVKVHSPIIIASINPAITNPDLLARSVRVPFKQRQGGYVSELEIRRQYAEDRPFVLGALLELFAKGLALLPDVVSQRIWKHRLVDFAQLGESVAQVLGMESGTFVSALDSMRQGVASDIVEGDGFVSAVIQFLHTAGESAKESDKWPSYRSWANKPGWVAVRQGDVIRVAVKPSALLEALKNSGKHSGTFGWTFDKWCPDNARAVTSILNLKLPLLTDLNIKATNQPDFGGQKNGAWLFAFKAP